MKLIIHPDDHQLFFHALEALHQGREESLTIEYRMISKDGVMHWIECRCRKVEHDEDGTVSHLIGTIVDITDKKKREHDLHKLNHALLASNERMHLIMAATNTSIWEYDVITDTNFWPDKLW
jgi:PAS domain-containing protein